MKIIFVTTESFMDHSYTMVHELKKLVDLDTIFVAKELTPEIENFCKKLNAKFVKRKRFINPIRLFFEFKLLMYIRAQRADLVWFNTLSLVQAFILKLFIQNPLISAHDVEIHPADTDYHGKLSQKLTFKLFKKSIAVMSRSQSDSFERIYGLKPYLMQLPIIDYYEASRERKDLRARDASRLRFLFFGSIQPYKGIEMLLKAAEILNSNKINYELNIYGKLRYNYGELTALMTNIENINFVNKHIDFKEIYNLFNYNDVVIIPYIHVTQSGPLLIGYNQNKPCITSDLAGFREYVVDGKSGLIFNNNPEDLAAKMQLLIENRNKIEEMTSYIITETKSKFSMQVLAPYYIEVFKKHKR